MQATIFLFALSVFATNASTKGCFGCPAIQSCAVCTASSEIPYTTRKRVTIDMSRCDGYNTLDWACCTGTSGGGKCTAATCDNNKSAVQGLKGSGLRCDNTRRQVYEVPLHATSLNLQVRDAKLMGNTDCATKQCCGRTGTTCARGGHGVCSVQVSLQHCQAPKTTPSLSTSVNPVPKTTTPAPKTTTPAPKTSTRPKTPAPTSSKPKPTIVPPHCLTCDAIKHCVVCTATTPGPQKKTKRVTINVARCNSPNPLSWACCVGTSGGGKCTKATCDGDRTGVTGLNNKGIRCDETRSQVYEVPDHATSLTLQVRDGKIIGNTDCSKKQCCGRTGTNCARGGYGVCTVHVRLDVCDKIPRTTPITSTTTPVTSTTTHTISTSTVPQTTTPSPKTSTICKTSTAMTTISTTHTVPMTTSITTTLTTTQITTSTRTTTRTETETVTTSISPVPTHCKKPRRCTNCAAIKSCAICTSMVMTRDGLHKRVTIDMRKCNHRKSLDWACCIKSSGGGKCKKAICDGHEKGVPGLNGLGPRCDDTRRQVYVVPINATSLTLQVQDGKIRGNTDCGKKPCCGHTGTKCAKGGYGVCTVRIPLDVETCKLRLPKTRTLPVATSTVLQTGTCVMDTTTVTHTILQTTSVPVRSTTIISEGPATTIFETEKELVTVYATEATATETTTIVKEKTTTVTGPASTETTSVYETTTVTLKPSPSECTVPAVSSSALPQPNTSSEVPSSSRAPSSSGYVPTPGTAAPKSASPSPAASGSASRSASRSASASGYASAPRSTSTTTTSTTAAASLSTAAQQATQGAVVSSGRTLSDIFSPLAALFFFL